MALFLLLTYLAFTLDVDITFKEQPNARIWAQIDCKCNKTLNCKMSQNTGLTLFGKNQKCKKKVFWRRT